MNLSLVIESHDAERTALIDGDTSITYGALRERVAVLRADLTSRGVGPGARVVLIAGNEPDFVVGALATLGVGAVVVPTRATSLLPELRRTFEVIAPAVVLVGGEGRWMLDQSTDLGYDIVDLAAVDGQPSSDPIVRREADDTAFLMLTSGVSHAPKVAELSHGSLAWVQEAMICDPATGQSIDDISLAVIPFSHIFGLNLVLLTTLRVGGTVVLMRRFDPELSLALIKRHQITRLSGAPQMWQRWVAADAPNDSLASVRHAASGAARLPMEVFDQVLDRFGIEIAEGYGLTETSSLVTWSRGMPVRPTSVGKPIPGIDVHLVDTDGAPVEVGDPGEIVVHGPGVFKGYLDAPEATAASLTPDGWFWTGDIGIFDEDGYLYLIDRNKDIVIVSGFNVYPSEVESVLNEHPLVHGSVVVGTPDERTGEAVVAHIVGDVGPDELDSFVRERLSRYKCPSEYHFVDELPRAANGKIVRRELRS